jgi:uncharacterized membrane protein
MVVIAGFPQFSGVHMKDLLSIQVLKQDARLALAPVVVACTCMAMAVNAMAADSAAGPPSPLYSVVNLGASGGTAVLNQRGQVLYSNVFFDGRRRYDIVASRGRYISARGFNSLGVVVGTFDDATTPPPFNIRAFTWTVDRGIRALAGPGSAAAMAINDRNQAVGSTPGVAITARANRWNPDGTQTKLGPLPASLSGATAVNVAGAAVGSTDVAGDGSHAVVWDAAGSATDLGKLGGYQSVADFVNTNGQVAGRSFSHENIGLKDHRTIGFFWSRKVGAVRILPFSWDDVTIDALNEAGQVIGNFVPPPGDLTQTFLPFIWCMDDGARQLPLGNNDKARVLALNNRMQMVGFTQQVFHDDTTRHAVFWDGINIPVDLNTRLYRAPAGLVLTSAIAINDSGAILAESNAGLVLLRPGTKQSPAPVLGPITKTMPGKTIAQNSTTDFIAEFVGSSTAATHVAAATVDDGCAQTPASLREVRGQGDVSVRHAFCKAGAFNLKIKVSDVVGNTAEVQRLQFVADPAVMTLMGQETLSSLSKQSTTTDKHPLQLTLWAPLTNGGAANTSRTAPGFVSASGPFSFRGEVTGSPVRNGQSVQLSGTGSMEGRAGYGFTLDATVDSSRGGSVNRLRLRISHQDPDSHTEVVDYDNAAAATGLATAVARTLDTSDRIPLVDGVWLVGGPPER